MLPMQASAYTNNIHTIWYYRHLLALKQPHRMVQQQGSIPVHAWVSRRERQYTGVKAMLIQRRAAVQKQATRTPREGAFLWLASAQLPFPKSEIGNTHCHSQSVADTEGLLGRGKPQERLCPGVLVAYLCPEALFSLQHWRTTHVSPAALAGCQPQQVAAHVNPENAPTHIQEVKRHTHSITCNRRAPQLLSAQGQYAHPSAPQQVCSGAAASSRQTCWRQQSRRLTRRRQPRAAGGCRHTLTPPAWPSAAQFDAPATNTTYASTSKPS